MTAATTLDPDDVHRVIAEASYCRCSTQYENPSSTFLIVQRISESFLDATFLDARWAREVENGLDGRRQLLGVIIGAEESEASWSDLLAQLRYLDMSSLKPMEQHANAA